MENTPIRYNNLKIRILYGNSALLDSSFGSWARSNNLNEILPISSICFSRAYLFVRKFARYVRDLTLARNEDLPNAKQENTYTCPFPFSDEIYSMKFNDERPDENSFLRKEKKNLQPLEMVRTKVNLMGGSFDLEHIF